MAIPMKTLKPHRYANKALKAGDKFDARGQGDARLLEALGRAERAAATPIAPSPKQPAVLQPPADKAPPAQQPANDRTVEDARAKFPLPAETFLKEPKPDPAAELTPAADLRVSPRTGQPVRTYRRRDLTAEGDE